MFGQDGWILASFFLCELMDLDFVSINMQKIRVKPEKCTKMLRNLSEKLRARLFTVPFSLRS